MSSNYAPNFVDRPMIVLSRPELEKIIFDVGNDNIQYEAFCGWLDRLDQLIVNEANFVITEAFNGQKGVNFYSHFRIEGKTLQLVLHGSDQAEFVEKNRMVANFAISREILRFNSEFVTWIVRPEDGLKLLQHAPSNTEGTDAALRMISEQEKQRKALDAYFDGYGIDIVKFATLNEQGKRRVKDNFVAKGGFLAELLANLAAAKLLEEKFNKAVSTHLSSRIWSTVQALLVSLYHYSCVKPEVVVIKEKEPAREKGSSPKQRSHSELISADHAIATFRKLGATTLVVASQSPLHAACRGFVRHKDKWFVIGHWRKREGHEQVWIASHWKGPKRNEPTGEQKATHVYHGEAPKTTLKSILNEVSKWSNEQLN